MYVFLGTSLICWGFNLEQFYLVDKFAESDGFLLSRAKIAKGDKVLGQFFLAYDGCEMTACTICLPHLSLHTPSGKGCHGADARIPEVSY